MVDACREAGVLPDGGVHVPPPPVVGGGARARRRRAGSDGCQAVHSWFSYFNDDPANIRNILDVGGGALYDIGCYSVNLSRMLFGAEPTRVAGGDPARPGARRRRPDQRRSSSSRTGIATFTCSTRAETDQRVHVYGTEGRISIEIPFNIPPDRPTRVFVDGRRRSARRARRPRR